MNRAELTSFSLPCWSLEYLRGTVRDYQYSSGDRSLTMSAITTYIQASRCFLLLLDWLDCFLVSSHRTHPCTIPKRFPCGCSVCRLCCSPG